MTRFVGDDTSTSLFERERERVAYRCVNDVNSVVVSSLVSDVSSLMESGVGVGDGDVSSLIELDVGVGDGDGIIFVESRVIASL